MMRVLFAAATLAGTVCGCYPYDCAEHVQCEDPAAEAACTADPAIASPNDGCGVFVSSSLGDDDNPGTRALPARTLARAIVIAQKGPMRVYACAEPFLESVEIPGGVELWGGLDCAEDWGYIGAAKRTTIAPGADMIPLRFLDGVGKAIAADVSAHAASATEPSGSSIGALVMPNASVEILRSELITGDGAAGAAGDRGGDEPAQKGADGWAGVAACNGNIVPGAPPAVTMCGTIESVGGQGGPGLVDHGGDGAIGKPEPIPNPQGNGLGGAGGTIAAMCDTGANGAHGAHGEPGRGGVGPGKIESSGWRGEPGKSGGDGLPGQGGGGGGGARGGAMCPDGANGGASGGSGGAGGCGGKGGKGGGYGGASMGLLTLSVDVTLRATAIVTSNGGDGGAGGSRQLGGANGLPGLAGMGVAGSPNACNGGPGGLGGDGGDGGGGLGGPSIGIAHIAGHPPLLLEVSIRNGAAGKGGPGGNPALSLTAGEDGLAGSIVGFPP
jgi:hypothetical protein